MTYDIELRTLIKGTFDMYDCQITERGIDVFISELKNSHEKFIVQAFFEYLCVEEVLPPEPHEIRAIVTDLCFKRVTNGFSQILH